MDRRNFIRNSSVSALSLGALLNSACTPQAKTEPADVLADAMDAFAFKEATIEELQKRMQSGEITSKEITQQYLDWIAAIDKAGSKINSIIELNPDALTIADALDKERKEGKVRGLLHGIPVLIKDNIDTADKMMTTAGSAALDGNRASADAFIVQQLRNAGAILLGKTNLSEWANFRSTRSTSGWSSRGGQTKNPYVLDRSPCGSSSGSGAAAAANMCTIAIGTETDGSIACPASTSSLVGIKPTVGLWSRAGIIPISQSQDTAGPLARTVRDAAILLGPLTGMDPNDAATSRSEGKALKDYTSFLDENGLKGKKIGVEKSLLKKHEGVDSLLQKALAQMTNAGATIVEVELLGKLKELGDAEFKVLEYEFKDGLNKYLSASNSKIKSLEELIRYNKDHESVMMPFFKQEILEASQALGDLQTKEYKDLSSKLVNTTRAAIDRILKDNGLTAICAPANGPSWCIDPVNGDFFTGYGFYSPAATAGYPSITVPMGDVMDLPVGLSFIAGAYSEPELIRVAYAYEQVSKNRKPPKFIQTK